MSGRRIRIGVIGGGSIAQQMHLPYLAELHDRFDVVGLCDVRGELATHVARQHGIPVATAEISELLALEPDAVLVSVNGPPERLVLAALAAGTHVLVEKPLAWTPRGASLIEQAAAASGRVVQVGYMKRHDPAVEVAVRIVAGMGPILGGIVRCVAGPNARYIDDVAQTVRGPEVGDAARVALEQEAESSLDEVVGRDETALRLAYRFLLGITCHELSVLRVLIGAADEIVSAAVWEGGRWILATLRYEDALVVYLLGRVGTRSFEEVFELYSEREALSLSFPSPFLKNAPAIVTHRRDRGREAVEERIVASYEEAFRLQLVDFHRCVIAGAQPRANARDAAHDAQILSAIIRAARDGRAQAIT